MGPLESSLQHAFDSNFGKPPWSSQMEAMKQIMRAYDQGYKNVVVIAPTGAGKSILGMGCAYASHKLGFRSHYITSMKSLQTQIVNDFTSLEEAKILAIVKGKQNYSCAILKETMYPYDASTSPCMDSDATVNIGHLRDERHLDKFPIMTDHPFLDRLTTKEALKFFDQPFMTKEAWKVRKECCEKGRCPYYAARDYAEESPICLINLPAYITWNITFNGPEPFFLPRDLNIFDECHKLEEWIRESLTLSMSETSLNDMFSKLFNTPAINHVEFNQFKPGNTPEEKQAFEFTEKICFKIVKEIDFLITKALTDKMRTKGLDINNPEDFGTFCLELADADPRDPVARAIKIRKTIEFLRECLEKDKNSLALEVIENKNEHGVLTGRSLNLKPVTFPPSISKLYGDKNLFMSATIPNFKVFCYGVGINPAETKFIELESTFPAEHRPIYFDPIAHFTHATEKREGLPLVQKVADKIEEIMDHFDGYKGLIHSGSFKRQQDIMMLNHFGLNPRMLWSVRGGGQYAAEEHVNSRREDPTVLIGPNYVEGVDLKQDLGRFQIILKCPFPVHTDPIIKKKSAKVPGYYDSLVATAIMQMVGRTTRSRNDWSITIILDDAVRKHIVEKKQFYPKYFRDAVMLRGLWKECNIERIKRSCENLK